MDNLRILLCCIFGYILSYVQAEQSAEVFVTDGVTPTSPSSCGSSADPCATFEQALARVDTTKLSTIKLTKAIELDKVIGGSQLAIQSSTAGTKLTLTIPEKLATTTAKAPFFAYIGASSMTDLTLAVPDGVQSGTTDAEEDISTLITTAGGFTMTSCDVTLTGTSYAFPIWTVTGGNLMLDSVTVKKDPAGSVSFFTALLSLTEAAEQSEVTVTYSTFEQISFTGTSPNTPSLIVAAKYKSLTLQDTLFNTITKAADNGPVLAVTIDATGNAVTITGCDFFKCAASGDASKGGALAFTISTVAPTIDSCCFAGSTIGSSATAEDVYFSTAPSATPFTNCFSTATAGVVVGTGDAPAWGLKSIFYVGAPGSGTAGSYENPYTTFTDATLNAEKMIAVKTSVTVEETNTFANVITIRPSLELETAAVELSAADGALIVGENGQVAVSSIEFTASASVTATKALWTVSGGMLELSHCTLGTKAIPKTVPGLVSIAKGSVGIDALSIADGVTLSQAPVVIDPTAETVSIILSNMDMTGSTVAPLVSHAGDANTEATIALHLDHVKCPAGSAVSLVVKKQTTLAGAIKNCEVKEGSVYANIEAGKRLIFSSFSFHSCIAEPDENGEAQGSGAALALELNGAADVQLGPVDDLFLPDLKAKHGQRILIVPNDGTTVDTLKTTFGDLATTKPKAGEEEYYCVKDGEGYAPLYDYLTAPSFTPADQTSYASAEGIELTSCGVEQAPCLSLSSAYGKLTGTTSNTVVVKGEGAVVVGGAITASKASKFLSEDSTKKGTIQIGNVAHIFTITAAVEFNSLKFTLSPGLAAFSKGVWAVGAGGALTLSKVEFVATDSLKVGGAAPLDKITSTNALITTIGPWTKISLTKCKFESIEIATDAAAASAAILNTVVGENQAVEIKGCSFTKCTSRKVGSMAGALSFFLSGTGANAKGSVTFDAEDLAKNTFSGCNTADTKQDSIYIDIMTEHNDLVMKNVEFTLPDPVPKDKAVVTFKYAPDNTAVLQATNLALTPPYTEEATAALYMVAVSGGGPIALKEFLSGSSPAPPSSIYVYVSSSAIQAGQRCTSAADPCDSITTALSTVPSATTLYIVGAAFVDLHGHTFENQVLTITKYRNQGQPAETCTVTVTMGTTFFIRTSTITFSDLTFTSAEETSTDGMRRNVKESRTTALFDVKSGKLVLSECIVQEVSIRQGFSLITSDGDVSLIGSHFNTISNTLGADGKAAVLDGTISGGKTVEIKGCSFTACTSTSGSAGALSVTVGEAPNIESNPATFTIDALEGTNTTFTGCKGKENKQESLRIVVGSQYARIAVKGDFGKDVKASGGAVVQVRTGEAEKDALKEKYWETIPDYKESEAKLYMVEVGGREPITLKEFFNPGGECVDAHSAYVKDKGDSSECCTAKTACHTISLALQAVPTATAVYVCGESYTVGAAVSFPEKDVSVTKDPKPAAEVVRCSVTVATLAKFVISTSTITFSELTFTSEEATSTDGMRRNEKEERQMEMFDVQDGKLVLSECIVDSVTISGPSLLRFSTSSDLSLTGTVFSNIKNTLGKGGTAAVVDGSIGAGKIVEIKGCTFEACTSMSGKAGALSVSVSGKFYIEEIAAGSQDESATLTKFSGCLVTEDKQETVYIRVEAVIADIGVRADFGKDVKADHGAVVQVRTGEAEKDALKEGNWATTPPFKEAQEELYMVKIGDADAISLRVFFEGTHAQPTPSLLPAVFLSSPSASSSAADEKECGSKEKPCLSLSFGITRLASPSDTSSPSSLQVVEETSTGSGPIKLKDVTLHPASSSSLATVNVKGSEESKKDSSSSSSLITAEGGVTIERIIFFFASSSPSPSFTYFLSYSSSSSSSYSSSSSFSSSSSSPSLSLISCSFICSGLSLPSFWSSSSAAGSVLFGQKGTEIKIEECSFARLGGERKEEEKEKESAEGKGNEDEVVNSVCEWSSSLLLFKGCTAHLKQVSILKSAKGGIRVEDGAVVEIDEGVFEANY